MGVLAPSQAYKDNGHADDDYDDNAMARVISIMLKHISE